MLYLTNLPSPYRVDFFNELGKKCDLTVLYELKNAKNREEAWKGNGALHFNEVFLTGIRIGNEAALCTSIIRYLKDNSYDLIIIGGYSTPTGMLAIEYLKIKNKAFIINSDGGFPKEDTKIIKFIKSHFIGSANAWLSTGKNTSEYLVEYGARKEDIFEYPFTSIKSQDIIDNLIRMEDKQLIKSKLGINEKILIVAVGQFIFRKGFDILIKSIVNIEKDSVVYIIGGKATDEYIELKERNNLKNIHFIEFKSKEKLQEYYKAADIFVLPTREDIWGLVINEAMSFGLPIITTDKCVAGLELIENDVNGYIVQVDNELDLNDKINKLSKDEQLRYEIGLNNITKIKKYTIENMAEKHIEIFNKYL